MSKSLDSSFPVMRYTIQDLRLRSITVAWAVRRTRYHPFPRYSRIVFLLMSCPENTPSSVYKNIFAQWLFHKELTFISQWKSIWFSLKGKKNFGEMVWKLKVVDALSEDLSLVLRTHMTAQNPKSCSGRPDRLFWLF